MYPAGICYVRDPYARQEQDKRQGTPESGRKTVEIIQEEDQQSEYIEIKLTYPSLETSGCFLLLGQVMGLL